MFEAALGSSAQPYRWQRALAEDGDLPEVLIAPTGSGKTAGVTLAWLCHRLRRPESTPRRLVWCLPMRTLVDQTNSEVRRWLGSLENEGLDPGGVLPRADDVHVLMGGVDSGRWVEAPERPAILVGTQDMLLSRALMRGYASSRAAWPMEFGVLHEDTQWVFDEVQLMGAGRATSAQLEAFRRHELARASEEGRPSGRRCRSLWVSATLEPEWLETVDHAAPTKVRRVDPAAEDDAKLRKLVRAPKHLSRADDAPESPSAQDEKAYLARLANSVVDAHRAGHMTLVIVNQVKRAQGLHDRVSKILAASRDPAPALALLHSRFRPADRKREMDKIVNTGAQADIIVIATQAVEAGVDISAAVMFTELAPWASMVQRFGRANRRAELADGADVFWIDLLGALEGDDKKVEKQAVTMSRPYEVEDLREARKQLASLKDVAPVHLPGPGDIDPPLRVLRRKDLDDLFDTDADLTGFDVDISPYVRDADDTDIRVFWRELPVSGDAPPKPSAQELCAVPIGLARKWIKAKRKLSQPLFFVRDPQWRRREGQPGSTPPGWEPFRDVPFPGLTLLVDVRAGGYLKSVGFTGDPKHVPEPVDPSEPAPDTAASPMAGYGQDQEAEGHDDDTLSESGIPIHLVDHLRHVTDEASLLCEALGLEAETRELVIRAARWHDLGKAHEVFQDTMRRGLDGRSVPEGVLLAKTVGKNVRHGRAYFRHELVSALAFLVHEDWLRGADLSAYLIAAHHGKVRLNLRALPRESAPTDSGRTGARFARGVWEGDELPAVELGGTERWEGGNLSLSIMELGWDEVTKESWTERTRELLARFGPFRLAWLETLVRVADRRASRKEGRV
ncbi:CRISPR-associated endonuclease Cas3'' [Candidatus Palauibacter sp.]|uniref:type I-G CRISPR-associated helicase/endonuclease Cas3g n=1 Tax=Candidatus Palauibacter sp. TaxID=3101350 RepID=UPI003B01B143